MESLLIIVAIGSLIAMLSERHTHQQMQVYWSRVCTGFAWRRRFPNASKTEIREFLDLFIDAFMFDRKKRFCFSPEDRVVDVYRAIYSSSRVADCMEMEIFCVDLQKRYGVDVSSSWHKDVTLGEIYEQTHYVSR